MNILVFLIPASLALGALGLWAFVWSVRAEQYDDLEGAAWRVLMEDAVPPQNGVDQDKSEDG